MRRSLKAGTSWLTRLKQPLASGPSIRYQSSDNSSNTDIGEGIGGDPRPPAKDTDPLQVSLDLAFPNIANFTYTRPPKAATEPGSGITQVTTLSNGLRVASEQKFGQFATVGVCIDSGSRYEVAYPSGVSHFLEKISYSSTEKFGSKDEILLRLEKYGGICDCQSTRDTFLYAASFDRRGLGPTCEILADVVLRPQIRDDELDMVRQAIRYEIEDAEMNPTQDVFGVEAIHAAAFANNTVGLPKVCPENNIDVINKKTLMHYLCNHHTPERMVVAGVGVEHDQLVEYAQKYFVDSKPIWEGEKRIVPDGSTAQYTGGFVTREKDLSNASLGPTPFPELAHVTIGLEGVSHQHPDFITFCVLSMLMGGGGSFSAGGPGKGMYSRLYTNVLNHHHWMYSATAFNHAYADGGVFCINASSPPEMLGELTQVLLSEFNKLTQPGQVREDELARAKKQLTSMLLMNLESRPVIFEDVARQVLAQGKREHPHHYISKIEAITMSDIKKVADKMLASKPSVAAIGTLKDLPEFNDIQLGLLDKNGSLPGRVRSRFFR